MPNINPLKRLFDALSKARSEGNVDEITRLEGKIEKEQGEKKLPPEVLHINHRKKEDTSSINTEGHLDK